MEKMVTGELTRSLMILGMGSVGVFALLLRMIGKMRGSFTPYRQAALLYVLVSFITCSAVASLACFYIINQLAFFMVLQVSFLLAGIAHVYCMQAFLPWLGDSETIWPELLFTLLTGLTGSIGLVVVYRFFYSDGLQNEMAASMAFFVIPWFFHQTSKKAIAIPQRVFHQWFYPMDREREPPDDGLFKFLLVISFEFQKKGTEPHFTNFKVKAPAAMEMGELFYHFINDYNDRHPADKITYTDGMDEPNGWTFYKKRPWYSPWTRHVHPNKTISGNRIKENDVIICSRTPNQQNTDV